MNINLKGGEEIGHDIFGYNQNGESIAYARFSMSNSAAGILYRLLDATEFDGGVSGIGAKETYSIQQMEKSLENFKRIYYRIGSSKHENSFLEQDLEQISNFITKCLQTANEEGDVTVIFA